MSENTVTADFMSWISDQFRDHEADIRNCLKETEKNKRLVITAKLRFKNTGTVFKPTYSISIPRAAVTETAEPDRQLSLPGVAK